MPVLRAFDYAIIRLVPRVERQEFVNVGVIVCCQATDFLVARFALNEELLKLFAPQLNLEEVRAHLAAIEMICAGGARAGTIGQLPRRARFDWLVAPRSTIIQSSPVHSGLCQSPSVALDELLNKMVGALN